MLKFTSTLRAGADYYAAAKRQLPFATAVALNKTAQAVREALVEKSRQVFDRPTPYTLNALRVSRATKENLSARIDYRDATAKGIGADRYLSPQVLGGARRHKRSERALQRSGLPAGSFLMPAAGAELDAYGNMSRGQTVRLLSYFEAFGEQGYRANASAKSRARIAQVSTSKEGYRKINGVQYFISHGKGSMSGNRRQHLPAGVWRKTGMHGADVKPVLLAIDQPTYTPRLPFYETASEVYGERFDAEFSTAWDAALATAR
ncbi:hypothetical protein [Achromobacter kerstersii]|uniref:hypothetical protein n=1 Tax=Achromobacter kerstersii TaxID=1353890 RepID=UPI003208B210